MQFHRLSLVITLALCGYASAAGFQLAETSATGQGRSYAGAAAIADNASSQSRNAALLLDLNGTQLSTGVVYLSPNINSTGTTSIATEMGTTSVNADADGLIPEAFIPNAFISHKLNEKWGIGIGLVSNYGLKSELDEAHAAAFLGTSSEITTVELTPNMAYAINEQWRLGAGLRLVYTEGVIEGYGPYWLTGLAGTELSHVSGEDRLAVGYHLGALWQHQHTRIGLAYHSELNLTLDGEYRAITLPTTAAVDARLSVNLPAFLEMAIAHQWTPALMLSASVKWTQWSRFNDLIVQTNESDPILLKKEEFKDNWRYAIGVDYQLNPQWATRAGIALDKAAVNDEHRTLSIPDSDRLWFSAGLSYHINKQTSIDTSLTYLTSIGDAPVNETNLMLDATYNGDVDGSVMLYGVQLNYRF
ncbi:MAG: outer membrane protein transport protein [Ferrimonas sp.]